VKSERVKLLYVRFCYRLGAVLDALLAFGLARYVVCGKLIYVGYPPATSETTFMARQAIPLLMGWTFLLIWGDRKPVERRPILLLTALPVVWVGVLFDAFLLIRGNTISSLANSWPPFVVAVLFTVAYVVSGSLDPTA